MERDEWRQLVVFVFLLGTLTSIFLSPWLLIPDVIMLVILAVVRPRRSGRAVPSLRAKVK